MPIDPKSFPDQPKPDTSSFPDQPQDQEEQFLRNEGFNAYKPSQDSPKQDFISQLSSKVGEATKAAVAPITALSKPIASMAQNIVAPLPETVDEAHAAGHQHPSENAYDYERGPNYPGTGITELGPSLDVMMAGQAGKDIAEFGAKTIGKSIAKKKALEAFIESSKTPIAEGVPTEPISANNIIPKSAVEPSLGLDEKITTATVKELPVVTQDQIPTDKPVAVFRGSGFGGDFFDVYNSPLNSSSNVRVTLSGPEGLKKIQDAGIEIIGKIPEAGAKNPTGLTTTSTELVKPATPKQLEFPDQLQSKGIVFNTRQTNEIQKAAGTELPKVEPSFGKLIPGKGDITRLGPAETMVPKTEGAKSIERAKYDQMKEPITGAHEVTQETQPLLPGANERIKAFEDIPSTQIDPRNPLTSRAEINKKVGELEKTATDQWLVGVNAENKAIEEGLKAKTGLRQATIIKPNSLESQALFHYIENPNKMEAYGQIASTAGKETADEIAKGESYIRSQLDSILPEVNKVRQANGLEPIQYRGDYITHMNEMNILSSLNKLDILGSAEGAEIAKGVASADAKIAQSNPNLYSKLKEVIFPYVQRKNAEHATDAINAFDRYIDNAHRYIETQPYVNELLSSATAVESKNPNLANYLRQQANYISGGRSPIDKAAEMVVDKDLIKIAQQLQNNAKGNVIALNPSVPITQLFGLTSTIGKYPLKDSLMASMQSFADPELQKYALANSPVLQTRALQVAENSLNMGKISAASAKIISWFDYKVAEISWMSAFKNAIKTKSLPEALNEANEWAAITQSHQGRVSTSPLMQSKVVQTILPLMNQQVAAGRSLLLHTFQGKTLTEKTMAAAKMTAFGTAVSALKTAVTGHEDNPLSPTNVIPFGGVLERGMGGPVFNAAARMAQAKNGSDFTRQLIRTGFLLQNKIPGGVIVGKQVENALMGAPKKSKRK